MTFLSIPFPVIDPVFLSLGPLQLRWYGLSYLVGILLAWYYSKRTAKRADIWPANQSPISPVQLSDFIFWATLGIILGGRIGYVLFYNFKAHLEDPLQIFAVWNGGMSFHGGFLGVTLAMILFAKFKKLSLLSLFDLIAMAAPIGLFFGRLANFVNAELYGRTTDLPWGIVFPNAGPLPRHPSQLYEAMLEGVLLFIVLRIAAYQFKTLKKPGLVAGLFAILYATFRSLVELVRVPDAHIGYFSYGTTMGMWLSLPMLLAGLLMCLYALKKSNNAREQTG